jgi:DNA-binding transcriptional LysR family regulator
MLGNDLNLVRVLVALAVHRRVATAAKALQITQPGLSNALRRLRAAYGDELFIRTSQGMQPTPRAVPLIEAGRQIIAIYDTQMSGKEEFSPATTQTELHLAMSDIGELVFLPRLLAHLRHVAPGATLRTFTLPPTALAQALEAGDIDLAVGYFPDLKGSNFFQQKLFSHGFVCLVRADHPSVGAKISRGQFLELQHAVVHAEGRSQEVFEQYLVRKRIRRNVVLQVPHFMSIPIVIARSDLIVTVPLAVGTSLAAGANLRLVAPPFAIPRFDLKQHWHRRVNGDLRNRWIRTQFKDLFTYADDEWKDVL